MPIYPIFELSEDTKPDRNPIMTGNIFCERDIALSFELLAFSSRTALRMHSQSLNLNLKCTAAFTSQGKNP